MINLLIVHNKYKKFSGEEHALLQIERMLTSRGISVDTFYQESSDIHGLINKIKSFFTGVYSPRVLKELDAYLSLKKFDVALVQNIYPKFSPSVFDVLRRNKIKIIMRCPNYRLFCPNGLHLNNGNICEKCVGGREWNAFLDNCENDRLKSLGYAIRAWWARSSRKITRSVDLYYVLTEFQKNKFISNGIPSKRIVVLPNVVPQNSVCLNNNGSDNSIIFVGRVSLEKGISIFLDIARRCPQYTFKVIGDYTGYEKVAEASPFNVKWIGFCDQNKLAELYKQSKVMLFPSIWYEGFPNVVTSAMAYGKPVVAFRVGGVQNIIDDGINGYLVPLGDIDSMVVKIDQLMKDNSLCSRLGMAGEIKSSTRYSSEVVSQVLVDSIRELVEGES